MKKNFALGLCVMAIGGGAESIQAARALAISAPIHITQDVNMRAGTNSSTARVGGIYHGSSPDFNCWAQGENVGGVDVWFKVNYNGVTGFYASYYDDSRYATDSQITSKYGIPPCPGGPTTPPPPSPGTTADRTAANVVNWAAAHSGVLYATPAEHRLLAQVGADWAARNDGPYGEWSGDCYRFAFLAWYVNGVRPIQAQGATAQAAGDAYQRAGRMHGGVPPAGAMVFYTYSYFGHVGISLGNGQVMSTHGLDYGYQPISARPWNAMGLPYRGWVDPRS